MSEVSKSGDITLSIALILFQSLESNVPWSPKPALLMRKWTLRFCEASHSTKATR